MHDATEIIEAALASEDGLPAVAEILANSPSFEIPRISEAIIRYFSKPVQLVRHSEGLKPKRVEKTVPTTPTRVTGSLKSDFIRLGSPRFLNRLIYSPRKEVTDIIAGYCILEIFMRGQKLEFITYEKAIKAFEADRFTFDIVGVGQVQLGFVNPNQPKRPVLKF